MKESLRGAIKFSLREKKEKFLKARKNFLNIKRQNFSKFNLKYLIFKGQGSSLGSQINFPSAK